MSKVLAMYQAGTLAELFTGELPNHLDRLLTANHGNPDWQDMLEEYDLAYLEKCVDDYNQATNYGAF